MDTNKQKQLPKLSEYNKKEYWNERFTNEEDYEWLVSYQEVQQQLDLAIESKDKKVVIIGCGNSSIGSDMVEHGYNDIHNIDYSSKVIQKMKTRHPKQNYAEMDIRDLQYADGSVDVILDKATIDSLQVDIKDPLNVEQSILDDLENVLLGCHRVLKADGVLIMISFQQPHLRRKIIERECYQWIVEVQKIEKGFGYFMYVCRKVDKAKFDIELQARKEKEEERQKQMEEYEEMKKQNRVDLEDESQFDIFKMQVD